MVIQNHIVKKFLLQLDMPGYQQNYAIQRRCTSLVKENLATGLDKLLTDNFTGEENVRISKIEIDLGNIYETQLEEEFANKLMQALTEKIKKIATDRKAAVNEETPVSEDLIRIEAFLTFLKKGVLPWTSYNIDFDVWEQSVLAAIERQSYYFAQHFYSLLRNNETAAKRLLAQFNEVFITGIIETALPFLKNKISYSIILIKQKAPAALQNEMVQGLFIQIIAAAFNIPALQKDALFITAPMQAAIKSENSTTNINAIETAVNELLKVIAPARSSMPIKNTKPIAEQPVSETEKDVLQPVEETPAEEEEKNNELFIQNAGLVLLHPFLDNFFTAAALMQEQQFNDEASRKKAVQLLQYVVNCETEVPEYLLTLNKILCGQPQSEHLDRFVKLTEDECAEADKLLQSVITHWTVLKNSSPGALQETFLQRSGKLFFSEAENGWVLHLEKKAVDILLEKIPWGFGYIRHPWMEYPLRVNW